MSENAQKPRIRFKGFSDAWEQRKFEDAFIERREKTVTENEDTLLSCAINGMFLNSELFGHFRGTTTIGYLKVKKNDLILSAQNLHLGNANVNLRFEHGIISPAYKVYDLNNCEPEFVQAWVKKEDTKNFFLAATTEGASQCRKNIEWDTLGKQTICMPAIKEQATIGSFFKCVDNLITLHQRKYDKLVAVKKSLLEKMFPADGETVPKIRFKGFSDAWEQRKLGDLFNYYRPDNYIVKSDKYVENAPTPVLTANKGFILGYTSENRTFSQPCIIFDDFTLDNKFVDFPFMVKSSAMKILVLKDEKFDDLIFCYELLNSTKIEVLGHARHYISVVQPTVVNIPRYEEQRRISELFQQISNLITLHQRQLEKLKNIKSALLEKMFV